MSDLTIGKIVNNSVTLVLSSSDQDGFGEKVVTANNFTAEDDDILAGQYNILAHSTDAVTLTHTPSGGVRTNKLYKNTFHFLKNGPVSGQSESKSSSSSESCSSSSCWLASSNPELPELPELPEDPLEPKDSSSTPESSSLGGLPIPFPILISNPRLSSPLLQCIAHPTARA